MPDVIVPVHEDATETETETEPLVPGATVEDLREATHESWQVRMHTWRFWWVCFVRILVFSVTGSLSVRLTSLFIHAVGFKGSFSEGPWWPYRIAFILATLPIYTCLILIIGTLAMQREYFQQLVGKMWGWMVPRRWIPLRQAAV